MAMAARIITSQQHYLHRIRYAPVIPPHKRQLIATNRQLSSSTKPPVPKSTSVVNSNNVDNDSPSPPTTSKLNQLIESLTSSASQTASRATEKATQAATKATEAAAQKARTAATKATSNIRHSISNAKVNAKQTGEQYVWEAHRSMARMGKDVKQSAKVTVQKTGERVKQSISEVSQSTANRLKDEVTQRIPTMPKIPSYSMPVLSSASSKKIMSESLPSKEALLKSASHIASETISKTTNNVTTQVQETVNKATRGLWWWGLAAVGVYGISTTLTKEGVQLLKDMVTSSKESLIGATSGISSAEAAAAAKTTTESNTNNVSHNNEADSRAADIIGEDGSEKSGRWPLSWFSFGANRNRSGNDKDSS